MPLHRAPSRTVLGNGFRGSAYAMLTAYPNAKETYVATLATHLQGSPRASPCPGFVPALAFPQPTPKARSRRLWDPPRIPGPGTCQATAAPDLSVVQRDPPAPALPGT